MSKYIVSVFDNETAAYAGARALGHLDDEGSIAVYEAAILAKEDNGSVRVLDAVEEAPVAALGRDVSGQLDRGSSAGLRECCLAPPPAP